MAQHREPAEPSGYWYPQEQKGGSDVEILNLLRTYRDSEISMRTRVRADMGMGERDLTALRLLLAAKSSGRTMRQKDLADALGITGASTSTMVDRLENYGYAQRIQHPEDRRSVAVVPTEEADVEVRKTLTAMHQRLRAVVEKLDPDQRVAVAQFLRDINEALN